MVKRQLWQAKFKGCRESLAGYPLTAIDSVFFRCPYDWHCYPPRCSLGCFSFLPAYSCLQLYVPQTVWDFFLINFFPPGLPELFSPRYSGTLMPRIKS